MAKEATPTLDKSFQAYHSCAHQLRHSPTVPVLRVKYLPQALSGDGAKFPSDVSLVLVLDTMPAAMRKAQELGIWHPSGR